MLGRTPPALSPPAFDSREHKRRRKALSCYDCRRRKLKCDRTFPACSRCVKAGLASACTYAFDEAESATGKLSNTADDREDPLQGDPIQGDLFQRARVKPLTPSSIVTANDAFPRRQGSGDIFDRLRKQEERISQLQSRVAYLERNVESPSDYGKQQEARHFSGEPTQFFIEHPNGPPHWQAELGRNLHIDTEISLFRGKGFKTQFYGASFPGSLLSEFSDVQPFIMGTIKRHPALARVRTEIRSLEKGRKDPAANLLISDQTLFDLLPDRDVVEPLVRLYLETFETVYHVLHVPSFWKEYLQFWKAPSQGRPGFVATTLLMMATVYCVSKSENLSFVGATSIIRDTAVTWISTCDSWLQTQSQKHMTLTYLQLCCLLQLAKRNNVVKAKRYWTSAGTLMRFAMSAGLHRDPTLLAIPSKISQFDGEMKRRIWATIMELELQASIDRGMPSSLNALSFDCSAPHNVDDEQLEESVQELPMPKLPNEFTLTSFLTEARKSIALRSSLNALISDPRSTMELPEILLYEDRIMQGLRNVPDWTSNEVARGRGAQMPQVLLDLQLRQHLLLLHARFGRNSTSVSLRNYSRIMCLNAATYIIDLQYRIDRKVNAALSLLRDDIFQTAVSVCYDLSVTNPSNGNHFQSSTGSVNAAFELVEKALEMLEDKVLRLGSGISQFWLVCAAYGFVKAKLFPDQATAQEQRAADRMTSLYYRFLSLQADQSHETNLTPLPNQSSSTAPLAHDASNVNYIPEHMPDLPEVPMLAPGFEAIDFADMDQWFLDDM